MILSVIGRNDDPPDEPGPPCDVCCREAGSCICPPCKYCHEVGNPNCYEGRPGERLELNRDQALGRIRYRASLYAEAATREAQYADWLETSGGEVSPNIEDYPTTI